MSQTVVKSNKSQAVAATKVVAKSISQNQEVNMNMENQNFVGVEAEEVDEVVLSLREQVMEIDFNAIEIERTVFENERGRVEFILNEEGEVKSISFNIGAPEADTEHLITWGDGEQDPTMNISLMRTWLNIILGGDFRQGITEDGYLVNNGAKIGGYKPVGWKFVEDDQGAFIEAAFCYRNGRYSSKSLFKTGTRDYTHPKLHIPAFRRCFAAVAYFDGTMNRILHVSNRMRPWANAVLRTLQLEEKFWPVVRSIKTDLVVEERESYEKVYKPAREAHDEAKAAGPKVYNKFMAEKAKEAVDFEVWACDNRIITLDQVDFSSGYIIMSWPNGLTWKRINKDDPTLLEKIRQYNEKGLGVRPAYVLDK